MLQVGREAGGGEVGGEAGVGRMQRREGEAMIITPEQRRGGDAEGEAGVETVVKPQGSRGAMEAETLAVEQGDDRFHLIRVRVRVRV